MPANAETQIEHTGLCDLGTSIRWHDVSGVWTNAIYWPRLCLQIRYRNSPQAVASNNPNQKNSLSNRPVNKNSGKTVIM